MGTEPHDHEQRIAEAIRAMAEEQGQLSAPPDTLWGRIERAVEETADDDPAPVPPPGDLWDRIAEDVRVDGGRAPGSKRRRRPRTVGLVAAAVVVVCALVAAAVLFDRGTDGSATELVARASLTGDGLDPGGDSTGAAELLEGDSGWKVAIQVDDLPELPAGSYYEAWLLGSGPGQVQSLGAVKGNERFAVPEGLALDDFPLVDVSIEPIDGNPAHSSKSVLRGELEPT